MIKVKEHDVEISGELGQILKEIGVLFQALAIATKDLEKRGVIYAMLLIQLRENFKTEKEDNHGSTADA